MKITIEIPDDELKEALKVELVHRIVEDNSWRSDRRVFRKEYGQIVKEMIYQPDIKADIIQRTVESAASEIRRKAMPMLMKSLLTNQKEEDANAKV